MVSLTGSMEKAQCFGQTHPMWTQDAQYFVFRGGAEMKPQALHVPTGRVRQIVDEDASAAALDPKTGRLYYAVGHNVRAISVPLAHRKVAAARSVAELPARVQQMEGGMSVDCKGGFLYAGALIEPGKKWAILALSLESNRWQLVIETDFPVGHIQANPSITGIIMFGHQSDTNVPLRTWLVNASGTNMRPLYKPTYGEWVTHQVWWTGTQALFTIHPYDAEHVAKPHGAAGADMASGALKIYAQFRAWHISGSPDRKWIVADDTSGNLWLIRPEAAERRLLSQGHRANGQTHPHPTFTPDSKAVVCNSSANGKEEIMMVPLPEWDSLTPAE